MKKNLELGEEMEHEMSGSLANLEVFFLNRRQRSGILNNFLLLHRDGRGYFGTAGLLLLNCTHGLVVT